MAGTVVLEDRGFLEAPRWHDGRLYISDLHRHEVLAVTPGEPAEVVATLDDQPCGLGFGPDGMALVVSMLNRQLLRLTDLSRYADLADLTRGGVNDLIVDERGRAYVGSFGYDVFGGEQRAPGNLVLVDEAGRARVVADDLGFPNGMAFTTAATLLVAETSANRITEFDVSDDGSLSGRRVWAELPAGPDGVAIDTEGALWVALPRQGRFVRVAEGGEIDHEISARPGWRAIACGFGGTDRRTLYLSMTLIEGTSARAALESVEVAVPGLI